MEGVRLQVGVNNGAKVDFPMEKPRALRKKSLIGLGIFSTPRKFCKRVGYPIEKREIKMNDLIQDTMSTMLGEDTELSSEGNIVEISKSDYNLILEKTDILDMRLKDKNYSLIIFRGYSYNINRSFSKIIRKEGSLEIQLYLTKDSNNIRLTYKLFYHSTSKKPCISVIGNPTSLINSHNTSPIYLTKDVFKSGIITSRVCFDFLFCILDIENLLSKSIQDRLRRGDILVNNTQWALYIKCKDKAQAIDVLKMSYGRDLPGTELPRKKLCNLIGFSMLYDEDFAGSGFLLIQKHYKNKVLTINFYDKAKSNSDKKTSGLSDEELEIVNNHLRLDITAHKLYLDHVFNKAKAVARKLIETKTKIKYLHKDTIVEFANFKNLRTTSRNLIISYILLSCHYDNSNKQWIKYSFSRWLKNDILVNRLLLDKILSFKGRINIDNLNEWELDIVNRWELGEKINYKSSGEWKRLNRLEEKVGVSFKLPYDMLEAIVILDSIYGLDKQSRNRYTKLLSKKGKLSQSETNELESMRKISMFNMQETRKALAYDFGLSLSPPSVNHKLLGDTYEYE